MMVVNSVIVMASSFISTDLLTSCIPITDESEGRTVSLKGRNEKCVEFPDSYCRNLLIPFPCLLGKAESFQLTRFELPWRFWRPEGLGQIPLKENLFFSRCSTQF